MSEAWLNFAAIICIQLVLFLAVAVYQKRLSDVPSILVHGLLIGIPLGLGFDLIVGKYLGLSSYVLGFGPLFLLFNALLSYGLFAATVLLLKHMRLLHLSAFTVLIMAVYEIANLFFPVWRWEFTLPIIPFLIVLVVGYVGGSIFVIQMSRILRLR